MKKTKQGIRRRKDIDGVYYEGWGTDTDCRSVIWTRDSNKYQLQDMHKEAKTQLLRMFDAEIDAAECEIAALRDVIGRLRFGRGEIAGGRTSPISPLLALTHAKEKAAKKAKAWYDALEHKDMLRRLRTHKG